MEEKAEEKIGIRYMDIEDVAMWERNPKRHDIGSIVESIRRYGFRDAPIYDRTLGCLIVGNGRGEALRMMKAGGEEAPMGVEVRGGRWYMPVQVGIDARSIGEGEAFGLDHNNIGLLGGDFTIVEIGKIWEEGFIEIGKELVIEGIGAVSFDGDDIDYLLGKEREEKGGDTVWIKEGDVWKIGIKYVIYKEGRDVTCKGEEGEVIEEVERLEREMKVRARRAKITWRR